MKPCTFRPKSKKFQKIHPKRTSLYFRKWNFLALILRNFRKLKPSRKSHIFQETKTPKKILIFCKMELSVHPEKISYIFSKESLLSKGKPEKILYIPGKSFQGLFIFQESFYISSSNFPSSKTKKNPL